MQSEGPGQHSLGWGAPRGTKGRPCRRESPGPAHCPCLALSEVARGHRRASHAHLWARSPWFPSPSTERPSQGASLGWWLGLEPWGDHPQPLWGPSAQPHPSSSLQGRPSCSPFRLTFSVGRAAQSLCVCVEGQLEGLLGRSFCVRACMSVCVLGKGPLWGSGLPTVTDPGHQHLLCLILGQAPA